MLRREDGAPVPGGGGWERLNECVYDIVGWVRFALREGFGGVILIGHSMGARKAAYYMAERQDANVVGLIAASPVARPIAAYNDEMIKMAQAIVDEGRGRDLMPWPELGCSMSAQTFLDHADMESPFQNTFCVSGSGSSPVVAKVTCPLLAFYGGEERSGAINRQEELDTVRRNATAASRVDTLMIRRAGHIYEGHEADVAEAIANWAGTLPAR